MMLINSVFQYEEGIKGERIRIRIIDIIENYAYLVNINSATTVPKKELLNKLEDEISAGKLVAIRDPFVRMLEEKNLSKVQIEKRNADWTLVEKFWEQNKLQLIEKKHREKKFKEIADESGLEILKVKRIFSKFWQRGMSKNALLPNYSNSGARGKERKLSEKKVGRPNRTSYIYESSIGINVTEDVKKHFELAINKYYRNKKQMSLREAYNLMLKDFYSDVYKENNRIKYIIWDSDRIPQYNQFYYWFKKQEDVKKDIILRKSDKEFNLEERPLLSNSSIETDGPGTRFQVDATIADVYLVSSINRNKIIGRPIVYAIIDVYSRLITGIYVGLEGPSWIGAMMALDNMIADKVEFCELYGIKISEEQWPAKHIPDIIIADRGEFEGYSPENIINNLNIKIENTSPYRGDLKGIVERSFRTLNGKIKHKVPGAILKEFRKRGDRDYRLDATLTIEEFTKIYINIVLHHNNKVIEKYPAEKEMIGDGKIPTPIQLWNWGIENKKGRLKTIDRDVVRLNILPRGKASVSRAGIKFKGLSYSSDKAIREQWFVKPKVRSIEIVYDPRNMNKIFLLDANGIEYEECFLLEKSFQYKNCNIEEIVFSNELLSELKSKSVREQNQNNVDLDKEINTIVKQAVKNKQKNLDVGTSKNKQLRGIKNNRGLEKEINQKSEAFEVGKTTKNIKDEAKILGIEAVNKKAKKAEDSEKDRIMDMLKKKRDEIRDKR